MENNRSLDEAWLQMPRATYPQSALMLEYQSFFPWVYLVVVLAIGIPQVFHKRGNALVAAPVMGSKIPYYRRLQFLNDAKTPVQEGYNKFKDRMYKLVGNEMLVLPNKFVDELRSIPEQRLSSMIANIDNFQGNYSTIDILLEGNLHTHVIQTRLTPKLGTLVAPICQEIRQSLATELPPCKDSWTATPAFELIVRLIARNFARTAVGPGLSRNKAWLSVAVAYPENVFKTVILMRVIPAWLKPLASWFIPYTWSVSRNLREALRLLVPMINERRRLEAAEGPAYEKPNDLLQWMMEEAWCERDARAEKLVHRLLVLAMASVHTTSMACAQAFFDLCEHPEYVEPLREEILEAVRATGGWKKTTLTRMRKMDSFMRESQRLNPPSLIGFKRHVVEPLTLSDGTYLPKGVHLVMPVVPIAQDESVTSYPLTFDGFRHYRRRQEPGQSNRYQFATTDENNMHFGHGKYACPGRFFAANTIKIILAHLILYYDFKLPDGKSRPENLCLHEYVFPDPKAEILFKEKCGEDPVPSFA